MNYLTSWISNIVNRWRNLDKRTRYITVTLSVGLIVTNILHSQYKKYKIAQKRKELEARGANKRNELQNKVHECFGKLDDIKENDITKNILSMSGTEIRSHIIKGNIDCKTVILIFSHNAHKTNKELKLNCILEEHYDAAYNEAVKLDKIISDYRNKSDSKEFELFLETKPLLGVPVSFKDHYVLKDSDCTCGTLKHCNAKYNKDGEMVELIRHFGGIPFVKTSCAQLNAVYETWNNIIGHTVHYLNNKRVVGGSSGGEACLIGSGCSVLGLGSDIGGSLRCPADWCGVISYKPTSSRCLQLGSNGPHGGYSNNTTIMPAFGPMARNMSDIIQFLKAYWSQYAFNLDPYMTQIEFRDNMYNSNNKLRIGYWYSDGLFMSSKSQRRAIDLSVKSLKDNQSDKYDIVEIKDYNLGFESFVLYLDCLGRESGMKAFLRALDGESLYSGYQTSVNFNNIPDWIKHDIFVPLLNKNKEYRLEEITKISSKYDKCALEIGNNIWKIQKFRYDFWKLMRDKYNVDLIITSVMPYPSPPIGFLEKAYISTSMCVLQNVLDCSAGSYSPICYVKKDECDYINDEMLPEKHKDSISKAIHQFMDGAQGMPVGIQIFGKPFHDELVLRVMTDLEKNLKK